MRELKSRLHALIGALSAGLVERDTAIRLALLAALAAEHLLLIGPPGTAKSELARRLHRAFRDASYFERLLTRFSVPEELFGPLSISALEEDRYERQTAGFLPTASIAFIDEVFKANSAILNALLTLLNEREFDNGAQRVCTPIISVIGASNEVPEDEVTAAFYDRFLLRCQLRPVSRAGFDALVRLPFTDALDVPGALRLGHDEPAAIAAKLDRVALPEEILAWLEALRAFLAEQDIYVSDRRWRKIVRLLKTSALTNGRDAVDIWDLWLLRFCAAHKPEQAALVAEWYERRLGVFEKLDPERFARVVEAFEAQLELEGKASELAYGEDGRLRLGENVGDAKGASLATRMTYMGTKRYGATHIAARMAQARMLIDELDEYLRRLAAMRETLQRAVGEHLWIDREFGPHADASLARTGEAVEKLRSRMALVLEGFASLPRLPADSGVVPEPIAP
ncbi:MAG: hypothetical protein OHK0026_00700 [Rhodocyclaceae bacterium]